MHKKDTNLELNTYGVDDTPPPQQLKTLAQNKNPIHKMSWHEKRTMFFPLEPHKKDLGKLKKLKEFAKDKLSKSIKILKREETKKDQKTKLPFHSHILCLALFWRLAKVRAYEE